MGTKRSLGLMGVAVLATGCGSLSSPAARAHQSSAHGAADIHLVSFENCGQMLAVLRPRALAEPVPASGAVSGAVPGALSSTAAGSMAAAPATSSPASSNGQSSVTFSTTNIQEQGVDEPDLAKTDGSVLVAIRQSPPGVEVASVGSAPAWRGFAALRAGTNPSGLFLVGGDVVVLGSSYSGPVGAVPAGAGAPVVTAVPYSGADTTVTVIDVSDPAQPQVLRSFTISGSEVDARLIHGIIDVVVQSQPVLMTPQAAASGGPSAFLPTVTNTTTGAASTPACADAMYDPSTTGDATVTVVPIDPASDQPGPGATVVGDASSVYASADRLYVASTSWPAPVDSTDPSAPDNPSTAISAFDLSDPAHPAYLGSGSVEGSLIGQYAMSEYQGYLRVATTVGQPSPAPSEGTAPAVLSDNRVTVLQMSNGHLDPVGQVVGLGAGEKIDAVRFVGPLGYVVTFNQTDPLYVLDLSDPAHPVLDGQVPLTGYSTILQPLDNGELLGVGQSVDASDRTAGLQVSLFDVSDPAQPTLLAKQVLAGASSSAEQDPHALLYWAPAQEVVLPLTQPSSSPDGSYFVGAMAWSVAGRTLTSLGTLAAPAPPLPTLGPVPTPVPLPMEPPSSPGAAVGGGGPASSGVAEPAMVPYRSGIERDMVVGSMLYSVTDQGIVVSDLATLHLLAWLAYPAAS